MQTPGVPLYFGANGEAMLRRAARHADGYVGSSATGIGTFNQNVAYVRNAARELGRDPDTLYIGKLQGVSVHQDAAKARELAATQWQSYYSPRFDVDRATIHGTPDVVAEKLREFNGLRGAGGHGNPRAANPGPRATGAALAHGEPCVDSAGECGHGGSRRS